MEPKIIVSIATSLQRSVCELRSQEEPPCVSSQITAKGSGGELKMNCVLVKRTSADRSSGKEQIDCKNKVEILGGKISPAG